MELLPENYDPSLVCVQRAQIQTLDGDCLAIDWDTAEEKAVSSWKHSYLRFHDPNITIRQILVHLGYPVPILVMEYGFLNAENFLDSAVRDVAISQARLSEKTQTVEMQCFLKMLQEYEAGDDSVREDIVMMADGLLFDEGGRPVWRNHGILADHDFHIVEERPVWAEVTIHTKRGAIRV